jgi:hypothetical protein
MAKIVGPTETDINNPNPKPAKTAENIKFIPL